MNNFIFIHGEDKDNRKNGSRLCRSLLTNKFPEQICLVKMTKAQILFLSPNLVKIRRAAKKEKIKIKINRQIIIIIC